MQKTLVLLALAAIATAQFLPGFPALNKTVLPPAAAFGGSSSFGVATSASLVSFASVSGQTASSGIIAINAPAALATLGLSVQFFVSANAVGYINVSSNAYTGGSFSSLNGVSPSGSASTGATGSASTNFGFTVVTNLTAGSFNITAVITPSAAVVPPQFTANLQLFYAVNATDGSNQAYSQGSSNTNFFGALPSSVATSGNVVQSITYTLPPVQYAVVSFASVNVGLGVNGATPAVFPVLYGTVANVVANATTVYQFATNFGLALYNQASGNISAAVSQAYNTQASVSVGASVSATSSGSFAGYNFNISDTKSIGVAYNVSVANQVNLTSTLVYNATGYALAAGRSLIWAFYNTTTNTAQILTNSVYDSASATVSVSVNHFSTYAVYSTSNSTDTSNNGSGGSTNNGTTTNPTTTGNPTPSTTGSSTTGSTSTGGSTPASKNSASASVLSAAVVLAAFALLF